MTPSEIREMLKKVYTNTDPEFEGAKFTMWWWHTLSPESKEKIWNGGKAIFVQDALLKLPDEELAFQYAVFKM